MATKLLRTCDSCYCEINETDAFLHIELEFNRVDPKEQQALRSNYSRVHLEYCEPCAKALGSVNMVQGLLREMAQEVRGFNKELEKKEP
jgi:hypothetical protein